MLFKKRTKSNVAVVQLKHFDEICGNGYTKLENNTDVQACIGLISDLISSMTIFLMENTNRGDTRVKNALSRKIDLEPYKYGTRKTLIYKVVKELLLKGNSILLPVFKKGLLDSLIPIVDTEYNLVDDGYGYLMKYKGKYLSHDEILHFVNNPDMSKPWLGMSYKVHLNDVIKNLDTTQRVKSKFYTKHYKPNIVFSFNSDTSDFQGLEGREKLFEKWIETKEGEPYMLPAEIIDTKIMPNMSIADLAINDSVSLDKKAVCSIFGVPPFVLGIGSYNEREWNNFINRTIVPICKEIEQELTSKIILSENWYFAFNLNSIRAFDWAGKNELLMEARKLGAINGNEIRINLGLQPVDDPIMDEYSMLENYIPNSMIGNQKKLVFKIKKEVEQEDED